MGGRNRMCDDRSLGVQNGYELQSRQLGPRSFTTGDVPEGEGLQAEETLQNEMVVRASAVDCAVNIKHA